MNYDVVHAIIYTITMIVMYFIYLKLKEIKIKNFKIIYGIIFALGLVIGSSPTIIFIKNRLLSFNSIERAFEYRNPNNEIITIFHYDTFSTIIYKNNAFGTVQVLNISYNNETWKLLPPPHVTSFVVYNNKCFVTEFYTPGDVIAIVISCLDIQSTIEPNRDYMVKDSGRNKFERVFFRYNNVFYKIIPDSEQYIVINNEIIYRKQQDF